MGAFVPFPWALGVETIWESEHQGPGQCGYWASGPREPCRPGWAKSCGWGVCVLGMGAELEHAPHGETCQTPGPHLRE